MSPRISNSIIHQIKSLRSTDNAILQHTQSVLKSYYNATIQQSKPVLKSYHGKQQIKSIVQWLTFLSFLLETVACG